MLNGKIDYIVPVNESQLPMFNHLGTDQKKRSEFPGGHGDFWTLSRNQMVKESLDWFDRYLGPVSRPAAP